MKHFIAYGLIVVATLVGGCGIICPAAERIVEDVEQGEVDRQAGKLSK